MMKSKYTKLSAPLHLVRNFKNHPVCAAQAICRSLPLLLFISCSTSASTSAFAQVITVKPLPTTQQLKQKQQAKQVKTVRKKTTASAPAKPSFRQPVLLWKTNLQRVEGTPLILEGNAYVGAEKKLYSIDRGGRTRWSVDIGPLSGSPSADSKNIYINSHRGALVAIDRETGKQAWEFAEATNTLLSRPAISENIAVVESTDDIVYAIDTTTGKEIWRFSRPDGSLGYSSPTIHEKDSVLVAGENILYRLNLSDGSLKWRSSLGGKAISKPEIGGGRVYVGGSQTGLTAVSLESGQKLWDFQGEKKNDWFGTPLYNSGIIYVTSYNRYVYAIDANTGTMKWSARLSGNAMNKPALDSERDILYVTSNTFRDNPTITALNPRTGKILWNYRAGYTSGSPALTYNRLYVGSFDGNLYCFKLD